jgi:O-glycosyl hydrolase
MFECLNSSAGFAAWVQAGIYLATLIVLYRQLSYLGEQTRIQNDALREQVKNTKYAEYIRCKVDFLQSMRQLISDGIHDEIYASINKEGQVKFTQDWSTYTPQQKKIYAYFEILYELFVRVYVLRREEVISKEEWATWEVWLNDVMSHPVFKNVHEDARAMYDKQFQEFIDGELRKIAK